MFLGLYQGKDFYNITDTEQRIQKSGIRNLPFQEAILEQKTPSKGQQPNFVDVYPPTSQTAVYKMV